MNAAFSAPTIRYRDPITEELATGGMGFDRHLRGNNPQDRMSALGQKQTSRHLQPMSALPPIADIADSGLDVR